MGMHSDWDFSSLCQEVFDKSKNCNNRINEMNE